MADFKEGTGQLPNGTAAKAVEGFQSGSEDFLTHLFMDSERAMEHAKRSTLMVSDLILFIRLRSYDETTLQNWEPLPESVNRELGRTQN